MAEDIKGAVFDTGNHFCRHIGRFLHILGDTSIHRCILARFPKRSRPVRIGKNAGLDLPRTQHGDANLRVA